MSNTVKRLFPLLDRILVRRLDAPATTPGGIMIPAKALKKFPQGEVIAVGPGARSTTGDLIPVLLKVGDKVVLPDHGGIKVNMEDHEEKEFHLFRESDILARVDVDVIPEPQSTPQVATVISQTATMTPQTA